MVLQQSQEGGVFLLLLLLLLLLLRIQAGACMMARMRMLRVRMEHRGQLEKLLAGWNDSSRVGRRKVMTAKLVPGDVRSMHRAHGGCRHPCAVVGDDVTSFCAPALEPGYSA